MELYLIRHGETVWNAKGLLQGKHDIELNEKGIIAAKKYGKKIENVYFDKIYSSPLQRAYKTAEIIKGNRNIQIITDERLRELSFGDCEGTDFRVWRENKCPYHWFFDDPAQYIAPRNGENLVDLCERTKDFIESVIEPQLNNATRIMIVAHGALNASIMTYLEKRDLSHFWGDGLQGNCEATVYTFNGKWALRADN